MFDTTLSLRLVTGVACRRPELLSVEGRGPATARALDDLPPAIRRSLLPEAPAAQGEAGR